MKRDLVGYGPKPPDVTWPNEAKIAVNFVINYEEGAELTPVNGDAYCESYGGEFHLTTRRKGERHFSMESLFEYGSRAGIWRLLRLFDGQGIPLTFFATGLALQLHPDVCDYLKTSSHEVAGHGWRWIDYHGMSRRKEKQHILQTIATIQRLTGHTPVGWYTGRKSQHTRALLNEIGSFLYDSDGYADDLPYYEKEHLILPYTLDCNDFRYVTTPGFNQPDDFYRHLQATFDYLYQENRMSFMTIALHPRISGHPGRTMAIQRFIAHLQNHSNVWVCKREDAARYWQTVVCLKDAEE